MSELPDSWARVPLDMVGSWGSGGTPTRTNDQYYAKEGIPWLVIGDLNDKVVFKSSNFITELGLANSSAKVVPVGTLLVAMYGSIGKLGITGIECATNQAIAFCKPNESIVSLRYLYHAMFNAKPDLLALGQGGAQQNISQSVLKEFEIPLAPKNEQTRISIQLDTLLTRIQSCNDRFDAIPALLKRFRQTVLDAAISGSFSGEEGAGTSSNPYPRVRLSEVADSRLGKMLDKQKNTGTPTPYIGNINVRWFAFDLDKLQLIYIEDREKQGLEIRDGDVFICEGGEPGRCAIWNLGSTNIVFQKALHRVRPAKDRLLPEWLAYCLRHLTDTEQLKPLYTGTTIRHLTGASLSQVLLPLPEVSEQAKIVRRVKALFALADRIEARATAARAHAQRLSPLVLAKAFRGELVPQDPQDEPVSALLGRIASSNTAVAGKKAKMPITNKKRAQAAIDL